MLFVSQGLEPVSPDNNPGDTGARWVGRVPVYFLVTIVSLATVLLSFIGAKLSFHPLYWLNQQARGGL